MKRAVSLAGILLCVVAGYPLLGFLFSVILFSLHIIRYELVVVGFFLDSMMRDMESPWVFPCYTLISLGVFFVLPMLQKYLFSSHNMLDVSL